MINTFLADIGTFFQQYWVIFVLLILIVAMYVISSVRRKKYNEQTQKMQEDLKPGVKVKTYSGFYGKIISIKETTDGKVALLEMGEGDKRGYITVDINAIYGVDQKEEVVYDKDGNMIVKENRNKKQLDSKEKDEQAAKSAPKTEEYETFADKKNNKKEK